MATIRVLLCCGAGFSSGFLAQKARQAAKKGKIDMSIEVVTPTGKIAHVH